MNNEQLAQELRAEMFGMQTALAASIRAIIATHPDPDALREALMREQQGMLALLTAGPYPDRSIDAFRRFWPLRDEGLQG